MAFLLFFQTAFGQDWHQWRGPNANGVSGETGLPVDWSPSESIAWKVKLPGRGMSTPIIWGDSHLRDFTNRIWQSGIPLSSLRRSGVERRRASDLRYPVLPTQRREVDGQAVWSRNLGKEYSPFQLLWGHGSSPVLHKEYLFLLCDHDP